MSKPKRNGRKFGLTMAAVACLIALILLYRHRVTAAIIAGSVAAAFALAALLAPRLLEPVEAAWMAFARLLGAVNTRIIMSLFYIFLIVPIGLFQRIFGRDQLKRRRWLAGHATNWEDYRARQRNERHYENMF
jgi:hypothetical protein